MKEIHLTKGQVALVDDEDYEYLNQWKWCAQWESHTKSYYASRKRYLGMINGKRKQKTIRMHRLIMDAPTGKQVDHINHNTLDNCKENLRIVTNRQNKQNRKHKGSSKYPGVSWIKSSSKWQATIHINGKNKNLGYFKEERAAAKTYENACRKLFNEELVCKMGESL